MPSIIPRPCKSACIFRTQKCDHKQMSRKCTGRFKGRLAAVAPQLGGLAASVAVSAFLVAQRQSGGGGRGSGGGSGGGGSGGDNNGGGSSANEVLQVARHSSTLPLVLASALT
jgi:uncharacterized membrane protein YgcG